MLYRINRIINNKRSVWEDCYFKNKKKAIDAANNMAHTSKEKEVVIVCEALSDGTYKEVYDVVSF